MSFHQPDQVRYLTFDSLENENLIHAVYSRRGGISPVPWDELNLGGTVGDAPENVAENRRLAFQSVNLSVESLYDVWQVHSSDVICTDMPRGLHTPHRLADAILTDRPEVTLFMRFADCVPIFLYDPRRKVIGMVHAGWQGTVNKIAARTIRVLSEEYHTDPRDVLAVIGPSICVDHYQVGEDVVALVQGSFGADSSALLKEKDSGLNFDLWEANRFLLEQAGVRQVEVAGICTACHPEDWFSHRGEHGKTGRFGAVIALKA